MLLLVKNLNRFIPRACAKLHNHIYHKSDHVYGYMGSVPSVLTHLLSRVFMTSLSKSLYILRFEEFTLDGSGCHSASVPSLFLILITRLFVFDKKSFISHANTANIGSSMKKKHNALAQAGYVVVVVDVSTPGETGEKSC